MDALVFSGGYGLPAFFDHNVTPMPRAIFDAFNTRPDRLIITPDVQAYPDLPDAALYAQCDLRTIAGAVLWREDRLIGLLNVKSIGRVRHFGDDELALLTGMAAQAAIAIENTRLVEAERRQRELAEALRESAEALNSTLNSEDVLDQILALSRAWYPTMPPVSLHWKVRGRPCDSLDRLCCSRSGRGSATDCSALSPAQRLAQDCRKRRTQRHQ